MNGHTPGPWELWTSCSWRRIGNSAGEVVCTPTVQSDGHPDLYFPNGGCDGPDALLIAAAPELLDFANYARSFFAALYGDDAESVRLADAAIAKATGAAA